MNSFICPLSDIGRHPREDGSVPVSSSTQCCSGLVSSIYLKVVQAHTHWEREGEKHRECRSPESPVCKPQISKMQHIYMHSNEHFEVFTTVLAPQGEWESCLRPSVAQHAIIYRQSRTEGE